MPFKPQHKMRCYCSKASSGEEVVDVDRAFHIVADPLKKTTTMPRAPTNSIEFKQKPKFIPIKRIVTKRDSKSSSIVTCLKRPEAATNSRMTLTAKASTKTAKKNSNAIRRKEPNYGVVFEPYRHKWQQPQHQWRQQQQQHQLQQKQQQQCPEQQQQQHFILTSNPKTGFNETKESSLEFLDTKMNENINREKPKQEQQLQQQQQHQQPRNQQVPYTEQRLCYERCKNLFPRKTFASSATTNEQKELLEYLENIANNSNKDLYILSNLQEFRLEHSSDCFNPERQNELKIQQYLETRKQNQCHDISPTPPIWSFDLDHLKSSLREIANDNESSCRIGVTHKRRNNDQQSTLASLASLSSSAVSSKLSEDNARKLNRIYLNKLKSPLSQSYALVFQGI